MVQDYADFADVDSFQQRLDYHFILNTNVLAGRYYIGVYNNDAYFKVRRCAAKQDLSQTAAAKCSLQAMSHGLWANLAIEVHGRAICISVCPSMYNVFRSAQQRVRMVGQASHCRRKVEVVCRRPHNFR